MISRVPPPAARTVVAQLLATGRDPQLGWPVLAKMLAQVRRGDPSTLDEMSRTASLGSTAADPRMVAGKNGLFAGVFCSDFGPQRDFAALGVRLTLALLEFQSSGEPRALIRCKPCRIGRPIGEIEKYHPSEDDSGRGLDDE